MSYPPDESQQTSRSADPPYGQPPMPATQGDYSTQSMDGDKASQLSLVFGIIGLFFAGLIFGPLAIWQASKAEKQGKSATAGKVLGWICTVWGIIQIVLFFTLAGSLLAAAS